VVLGYANHLVREVCMPVCQERQVPILRRCSGGGAVLQGPGCLNYSLVLRIEEAGPLATIQGTNTSIMGKHRDLFRNLLAEAEAINRIGPISRISETPPPVEIQGHTDLTLGALKFSGNAQRRRRRSVLFHGTFLLNFDLELLGQVLLHPSQEPGYRKGRPHAEFVTNLPLTPARVKQGLQECWGCNGEVSDAPWVRIDQLVKEKYGCEEWNRRA